MAVVQKRLQVTSPLPLRFESQDRLGRSEFARRVAVFIDKALTKQTFTIALDGPYGSGKSTVAAMVGAELIRLRRHKVIELDAWRVGTDEQFQAAVLNAVASHFRMDWPTIWAQVTWQRFRRLSPPTQVALIVPAMVTGLLLLAHLVGWIDVVKALGFEKENAILAALGVAAPALLAFVVRAAKPLADQTAKLWPVDPKAPPFDAFIEELEVYQEAMPANSKLVVIVEDIDRCAPARAIQALNAIAQIAGHPTSQRIVFIVPFDHRSIAGAVRSHLANEMGKDRNQIADRDIAEWLRKVAHVSICLPPEAPCHAIDSEEKAAVSGPGKTRQLIGSVLVSVFIISLFISLFISLPNYAYLPWAISIVVGFAWTAMHIGYKPSRPLAPNLTASDWFDFSQMAAFEKAAPMLGLSPRETVAAQNMAVASRYIINMSGNELSFKDAITLSAMAVRYPAAIHGSEGAFNVDAATHPSATDLDIFVVVEEAGFVSSLSAAGFERAPLLDARKRKAFAEAFLLWSRPKPEMPSVQ